MKVTPVTEPPVTDDLAGLRPFPEIERRNAMASDEERQRFFSATNNDQAYQAANREYIEALDRLGPALTPVGARVAADLRANGIAFADWSELFAPAFFETVKGMFDDLHDRFVTTTNPAKTRKGKGIYSDTIYKFHTFRSDDPVTDYVGAPAFAAVAAAYLGMVPRFTGTTFWRTRPAEGADRTHSQLWHRDYNDRGICKVFLYGTDVGPAEGYFEFITGSHVGGPLGGRWDTIGADGYRDYPPPAEAEALVGTLPVIELDTVPLAQRAGPSAPWDRRQTIVRCTAPRGTLIFCDTFGLHRGGYVHQGHRDMLMVIYSTNFNVHKPQFAVTRDYVRGTTPFMRMALGVEQAIPAERV